MLLEAESSKHVAAPSPATPETADPKLGDAEVSSQESDPSATPTPAGSSSSLNPISEPFVPSKEAHELSQRYNALKLFKSLILFLQ